MHGLAHRVDRQRLLEDLGRIGRDPGEVLVSHRQVSKKLGLGEGGGLVGIELASEDRPHAVDQSGPLRVQRIIGFAAGDDIRSHLTGPRVAGEEALGPRLTAGRDGRPDVGGLGELLHRIAAKQHVVEDALPEVLVEIGGKFRVGNAQGPRGIVEPRAVDHAILRVVEIARQPEHHLGRASQVVANLAREARHQRKSQRHIADICRSKTGVEPVGHMDVEPRHHQARVDQRRAKEPVDPGPPVLIERQRNGGEAKPHDHDDLQEALIAPISRPGGDRLKDIDQVVAAANRENLDHDAGLPPLSAR